MVIQSGNGKYTGRGKEHRSTRNTKHAQQPLDGRSPETDAWQVEADRLDPMRDLPGHEIVAKGLADLRTGEMTRDALLVAVAAERLRADGIEVSGTLPLHPKDRLWEMLEADVGDDVHGTYNALVGRVLSFLDAYETVHLAAGRDARSG